MSERILGEISVSERIQAATAQELSDFDQRLALISENLEILVQSYQSFLGVEADHYVLVGVNMHLYENLDKMTLSELLAVAIRYIAKTHNQEDSQTNP